MNSIDANGYCALAQAPNARTAAALIDAGADVNYHGREGLTPLMSAPVEGHIDVVRLLIQQGAHVNELNRTYQRTALGFATRNDHEDIAAIHRQACAH